MKSYPLRVMPGQHESVRSIMHRLSERNGFERVAWLMHDIGNRKITSPLTKSGLRRLSLLSAIPVLDLEGRQETKAERVTRLNNHNVPLGAIDRLQSRICPDCFKDDQQHRWTWDYLPLTHCPKHARPLLRECPHCLVPLRWLRPSFAVCPNEHSLLIPRGKMGAVDLRAVPVNHAIMALMTDPDSVSGNRPSLQEFVITCEILGCVGRDVEPAGRISSLERYLDPIYPEVMAAGFDILRDLPNRLPEVLDELSDGAANPLSPKSSEWRDRLHIRLCHFSEYPSVNKIARVLWSYAEKRKISLYPGAFGWEPAGFKAKYIAATTARELAKMEFKKFTSVARQNNWVGAAQMSTGSPSWLLRSEVVSWIAANEKLLTTTSSAALLGVTRETIQELNDLGVFGADAQGRKNLSVLMPRFKRREMDDFLLALKERAVHPSDPKDPITWMRFTKRPESGNLSFALIVQHILAGRIRIYKSVQPEIPKLLFSYTDALKVSRSAVSAVNLSNSGFRLGEHTLSLREASLEYKLGYHRMQQAVAFELVPLCQPGFGISKGFVTHKAMRAFLSAYTTPRLLAERLGSTTMSVTMTLRKLGVAPIGRTGKRDAVNGIFAMADVTKIGLSKLKAMTKPSA